MHTDEMAAAASATTTSREYIKIYYYNITMFKRYSSNDGDSTRSRKKKYII